MALCRFQWIGARYFGSSRDNGNLAVYSVRSGVCYRQKILENSNPSQDRGFETAGEEGKNMYDKYGKAVVNMQTAPVHGLGALTATARESRGP